MPFLKSYGKYSLASPSWMVKFVGEKAYKDLFKELSPPEKGAKVIDIGCGAGEKRTVLPKEFYYVGLDQPGCMHGSDNINVYSTAYEIPFLTNSFDLVFCTGVLEHLEKPQLAIDEAYRVINSGGKAVYTIPFIWHLHEEPRDFYRYTKYGIRHLFEKAGFEIEQITPLSGFWVTFGSEFNYYLAKFGRSIFKPFVSAIIAFNNLVFIGLEKFLRKDERWTWMYIVVARKKSDIN